MVFFKVLKASFLELVDDTEQRFIDRLNRGRRHRADLKNPVYAEAYEKSYIGGVKSKKLKKQFVKTGLAVVGLVILLIMWFISKVIFREANIYCLIGVPLLIAYLVFNCHGYGKFRKEVIIEAQDAVRKDNEKKATAQKERDKQAAATAEAARLAKEKQEAEKAKAERAAQKAAAQAQAKAASKKTPPAKPASSGKKKQPASPAKSQKDNAPRLEGFRPPL